MTKLYVAILSKKRKKLIFESNLVSKSYYTSSESIVDYIKTILKKEKINLEDIDEFVPVETESFTGFREALVVCNTLNFFLKSKKINQLVYSGYHKEPNITL